MIKKIIALRQVISISNRIIIKRKPGSRRQPEKIRETEIRRLLLELLQRTLKSPTFLLAMSKQMTPLLRNQMMPRLEKKTGLHNPRRHRRKIERSGTPWLEIL